MREPASAYSRHTRRPHLWLVALPRSLALSSSFPLRTLRFLAGYLRTWFALDLITGVPIDLILMFLGLEYYLDDQNYLDRIVKRFLKCLRLLKLMRLVRLSRIVKRMLARSDADPSLLELIKFAVMTLVMAHW